MAFAPASQVSGVFVFQPFECHCHKGSLDVPLLFFLFNGSCDVTADDGTLFQNDIISAYEDI